MREPDKKGFGKLRSFFWPIHNYELKKVLPMFVMFFFISLNYSLLRSTKDPLIQFANQGGTELIPFLKVAGVVPMAFLFMLIYSKLSNMMKKETLFYVSITIFIAFFTLFKFYLFPCREALFLDSTSDWISANLWPSMHHFGGILRNWMLALYYIFSELWGSVALSLLFWGFANDITKTNEAKRFYALFGLGANIALFASGYVIDFIKAYAGGLGYNEVETWSFMINSVINIMIISSVLIMFIYRWITKNVLTDERFFDPEEIKPKKKKEKLTLSQSFAVLARSKHLFFITTLVFAYGISIVLIEVLWKKKAQLYFGNPTDYLEFVGNYNKLTSTLTILLMLFVTSQSLRKFGWGFTALITPVVLLISGAGFFSFVIFSDNFQPILDHFGVTALAIAVLFGTIQTAMSKASKYSLFDPTKEMAYIPLDQDSKVKGKAAIDVVGARLGKAAGSGINLAFIAIFSDILLCAPYIAVCLFLVIACWINAVKGLNKSLHQMHAD